MSINVTLAQLGLVEPSGALCVCGGGGGGEGALGFNKCHWKSLGLSGA